MGTSERRLLELLIRHELAVKRLYELFSVMYPEAGDFWKHIAKEEQGHADNLATLRSRQDIEDWLASELQLTPELILKATSYVAEKTELTSQREINLRQAFSLAENIEKFLVDGVFSKLSAFAPKTILRVMVTLAEETKAHRDSVNVKRKEIYGK